MQARNDQVIVVKNLEKHYQKVQAIDGVSFSVNRGEIFGMLGPNGAGKTTTIECVEGLRKADCGEIKVLGLDPRKDGYRLRERIGIQFQSATLPNRIRVWEALDLFSSLYPDHTDWQNLLEKMGLEEKRNEVVSQLSGGQKQRVYIAMALVNNPEIVFLDELTTGLDPQSRRTMWELVQEVQAQGKTVFLTTHFMEEAERLCNRVAILDHGRIIALDSPQNLIDALGNESRVVFDTELTTPPSILCNLPGISRVEKIADHVIVYGGKEGLISRVADALERASISYRNIRSEQPTLEDVYLKLTGTEIRN